MMQNNLFFTKVNTKIMESVRSIKYKYSSLSGKFPSNKNNRTLSFESSLEKDFITLLEFDDDVVEYTEQPVRITYVNKGKKHTYYPDILVKRRSITGNSNSRSTLFEVKYSDHLTKYKAKLDPKFNAAREYSQTVGWEFQIITENEIRTDYLENARFLLKYRDYKSFPDYDFALLLDTLNKLDHTTPEELILIAAKDWNKRAELIYLLWHMVANKFIQCDLTFKLTMDSEIWPNLNL